MQRLVKPLVYACMALYTYTAILLISSAVAHAQAYTSLAPRLTPDCCQQAINLQTTNDALSKRLQTAQEEYDALSEASNRVIEQCDERADLLLKEANSQLSAQVELRKQAEGRLSTAHKLATDYASRGGLLGIGRRKQLRKLAQLLTTEP